MGVGDDGARHGGPDTDTEIAGRVLEALIGAGNEGAGHSHLDRNFSKSALRISRSSPYNSASFLEPSGNRADRPVAAEVIRHSQEVCFARHSNWSIADGTGRADDGTSRAHPQDPEDVAPPLRRPGGTSLRHRPQGGGGCLGRAIHPRRGGDRSGTAEYRRGMPEDAESAAGVAVSSAADESPGRKLERCNERAGFGAGG